MSTVNLRPCRASELGRTVACPGWRYAEATFPQPPKEKTGASSMRDSGTRVHDMIDLIVDGKPVELTLIEAEEWVVNQCVIMLGSLIEKHIGKGVKQYWTKKTLEWRDVTTGRLWLSGTPDYFATDGEGKWLVNDNKRGPKSVPEASLNWQVTAYICLIAKDRDLKKKYQMDEFIGVISQPLASLHPSPTVITGEDVLRLSRRIESAIVYSSQPDAPRFPGPHCEYCPARFNCPEHHAVGPVMLDRLEGIEKIKHLTPAELKSLKPRVDCLKKMIEAFDDTFKAAVAMNTVPGWEIYDHPAGHKPEDPIDLFRLIKDWISNREFRYLLSCPVGKIKQSVICRMREQTGITVKDAQLWWDQNIVPHMIELPKQKRVREVKK